MIDQLRQRLQALQKAPGIEGRPGTLPFGIPPSIRRSAEASPAVRFMKSRQLARRIFPQRPGLLWQW
jgi:hypothetical protein